MSILSDRNGGLVSFSQTLYFLLAGTCQSDKVTAALLANLPLGQRSYSFSETFRAECIQLEQNQRVTTASSREILA